MICVRFYKKGDTDPLNVRQVNYTNRQTARDGMRGLKRAGFVIIESFDPSSPAALRGRGDHISRG
jgi:hypothetical protein